MNQFIHFIHHLFIPRHTNNYRAKLLHHDFLTVYLVASLVLTIGAHAIQNTNGSILGFATDITVNKLYELTNKERTEAGVAPLKYNAKLSAAAENKAHDMFAKNYWAHYGPSGETPWEFILGSGYQYEYAGENLAKNFLFSDGVVKAWMESPTHRENILRKEYQDVGFAIMNGTLNGEETTLVVQTFGKPLYAIVPETQAAEPNKIPEQIQVKSQTELVKQAQSPAQTLSVIHTNKPFFPMYFNMNLVFIFILMIALGLDLYFATKLNFISLKGKNIIHMIFLLFITAGLFIFIKGSII